MGRRRPVRRQLLPDNPPRLRNLARAELDLTWMDHVEPTHGVLVTAQGLFMYLASSQVMTVIGACANRFTGPRLDVAEANRNSGSFTTSDAPL